MQREKWTSEQIEYLKEHYNNTSQEEMVRTLGRTWAAILEKGSRLKLRRAPISSWKKGTLTLTDLEIGYLAGLIDGEGSIGLTYDKTRNRLTPCLAIYNTNQKIVEHCKEILKGGIIKSYQIKPSRLIPTPKKRIFQIKFQSRWAILELLKLISPYLAGKKEQAELMIEYLSRKTRAGRWYKISDREIMIYNRMRELNSRRSWKPLKPN